MSKPKSTKTRKAPAKVAVDAKGHAKVVDADASVETAAVKPTKTTRKAPKEKAPKEDLMVFAFRLTKEESAAIHKAAGPGKASKFARSLLVAAAQNDEATIRAILKAVQTKA